jgi:hypothetical protein
MVIQLTPPPKYVTTAWILPILGDMGFDIQDERVKRACEYALSFQKPKGMFSRRGEGVSPKVARYQLYHLIEDDWLTYYMTRIAANVLEY